MVPGARVIHLFRVLLVVVGRETTRLKPRFPFPTQGEANRSSVMEGRVFLEFQNSSQPIPKGGQVSLYCIKHVHLNYPTNIGITRVTPSVMTLVVVSDG